MRLHTGASGGADEKLPCRQLQLGTQHDAALERMFKTQRAVQEAQIRAGRSKRGRSQGRLGASGINKNKGYPGRCVAPAAWRGHGVRGGVGASECSLVGGKNEGMHHAYWEKEGWV